jgi:hypothetical protein
MRTVVKVQVLLVGVALLASGCQTTLQHYPSARLSGMRVSQPKSVMVADIGDSRGGAGHAIAFGVSYWLPIGYYANEADTGAPYRVSAYIAKSLSEDLAQVGLDAKLANRQPEPMEREEALRVARERGVDYLVTTRVVAGRTNYWGFLIIPFVEPVWTRIAVDLEITDLKAANREPVDVRVSRKKTEWRFGKIFIGDSVFDAPIFGRYWCRNAWGKTVVSEALADAVEKIAEATR